MLLTLMACATSGQKYIDITYSGNPEETTKIKPDKIGISVGLSNFTDNRMDAVQGYIGRRILVDNSQETYFVKGMDLGLKLTRAASLFLEDKGYTPVSIEPWELTPNGVTKVSEKSTYLVAGTINRFECRAQKKGAVTDMVLEIDLTLYIGTPEKAVLKSVPVTFSLEKTELIFTEQKLEKFVNQSILEVFEKALVIE
ncbi:MAG: hypothetical protein L3J69_12590 [Desulfobacula sp.]|nr:hypothetical protein [Desulfobacula sp.]